MPDGSASLLISLIVLIFFSSFFSAAETAFSSLNKIKLKAKASSGNKRATKVLNLVENNYDKFLSTILIGNNIVNLTASAIATILFAKLLLNSTINSSVVSTAVITVVVLIFGEITPKYIAKSWSEPLALAFYPIIIGLSYVFTPINFFFSIWQLMLQKVFKLDKEEAITEEEIMTLVEEAKEDGTLKQEETNLIRSVIEFDDLEVCDILVPRVNIVAINKLATANEIHDLFNSTNFSRLPVFNGEIDSIIGTIHEKDFYRVYTVQNAEKNDFTINSIIQPSFFVPEHTKISKLLKQMQKEKIHMAIVLDEYGGTAGLVTMEDILEELVGEIYDEHDKSINYITQTQQNSFIVHGETPLNKMFKFFEMPEDEETESNTVSGWIIEKLGDFPEEGQTVTFENLNLKIVEVEGRTVQKLSVSVL